MDTRVDHNDAVGGVKPSSAAANPMEAHLSSGVATTIFATVGMRRVWSGSKIEDDTNYNLGQ